MAYLALNECPHGQRMVSLEDTTGGVRLTGLKCCGQWKELQQWPMTARQLREAAEECECAADLLEEAALAGAGAGGDAGGDEVKGDG